MKKGQFSGFTALVALLFLLSLTISVPAYPPQHGVDPKSVMVVGHIQLEGLVPNAPPQSVTITFVGTPDPMQFQFWTNSDTPVHFRLQPSPSYEMLVRGEKWLAQRVILSVSGRQVTFSVSLPGGDVNGDNRVDWDDLDILASAYGSTPGEPYWDARADLDCDGDVDDADADILFRNYYRYGH